MTIPGSIDSTGLFTAATTAGSWTNAIEATVGSVHGYANLAVSTSDEPTYNAGTNTLIFDDSSMVDAASSMADIYGVSSHSLTWWHTFGLDSAVTLISGGHDGLGNAIRATYAGTYQESHTLDSLYGDTHGQHSGIFVTSYFQMWAKMTLGGGALGSANIPLKWMMCWHNNGNRNQWNTHDHLPGPNYPAGIGCGWQNYDMSATAGQGDQPLGPYPKDVWDGAWHRYTGMWKPNSSSGARDGISRFWVDGTKIIDISASALGVTPTGGDRAWCAGDDIDALSTDGIYFLRWLPADLTLAYASGFTFDMDQARWWT